MSVLDTSPSWTPESDKCATGASLLFTQLGVLTLELDPVSWSVSEWMFVLVTWRVPMEAFIDLSLGVPTRIDKTGVVVAETFWNAGFVTS